MRRFYAGDVVPFRSGVPTLAIGGKKFVLSTDGGMLGDREDDSMLEEEYGGRVIGPPPGANKWRYLWAYDIEKQMVAMWRVSDGDEKAGGPARSFTHEILKLDKKGQINRVDSATFRKIESHMRSLEDDTLKALKKSYEDLKSEEAKAVDRELAAMWLKLEPRLVKELEAVERGAIPLGFKPQSNRFSVLNQALNYTITQFFDRNFDRTKMIDHLEKKFPLVHFQTFEWAYDDLRDAIYEIMLSPD